MLECMVGPEEEQGAKPVARWPSLLQGLGMQQRRIDCNHGFGSIGSSQSLKEKRKVRWGEDLCSKALVEEEGLILTCKGNKLIKRKKFLKGPERWTSR